MSEFDRQYFAPAPTVRTGRANHVIRDVDGRNLHGLRYSSPWPWMLALAVSFTMWGFLVWPLWQSFR
jgi:hypothetical protein